MKQELSHKINLFKEHRDIPCSENQTILKATLSAGVEHTHVCGGQAKCSTCRVSIKEGLENCSERSLAEQRMAKKLNFPDEIRLACQTYVTGDVTIRRIVGDKLDTDIVMDQFSENGQTALGVHKKLTIVFTDIINYTALAEKFPPYDVIHVLNRYYRIMNDVIRDHHGIISDVAGDGILAVYGITDQTTNSVLDAVKSLEGMLQKLDLFNDYLEENFNFNFGIRAGLHFGDVIVGPIDTGAMKKLAVIGDNVNYASRIESANKTFGTKILLSKEAYDEVKDHYPNYNLFTTTLKGKTGEYDLYEVKL